MTSSALIFISLFDSAPPFTKYEHPGNIAISFGCWADADAITSPNVEPSICDSETPHAARAAA
jgi:hypothetical protein